MVRKMKFVGWENSTTTIRPPGLVTRKASASAALVFEVFRSPNEMVVTSKRFASKGRLRASPKVKGRSGWRLRPASSIPGEKSSGITLAPASAKGRLDEPVPAARSRISMPGFGAMMAVATLRQALVRPSESRSLRKS